ncbi:hypothetical protein GCM10027280_39710 [Micromonospora polyrhachis]|uniref:Uncharacterized protein n=1 Tax=Micromonospora polyrhachis TaxID=1282883 RepID=A0A7W7SRU8_9ACTN|nr:hypothetical protein [Micromonospora polyrhachis]MBB4959827.1 hypothetical protein [Micromonospora polyrhachis]
MPDQQQPASAPNLCTTCFGARKVWGYALVDGRTQAVWVTCPGCNAPTRPVAGPE